MSHNRRYRYKLIAIPKTLDSGRFLWRKKAPNFIENTRHSYGYACVFIFIGNLFSHHIESAKPKRSGYINLVLLLFFIHSNIYGQTDQSGVADKELEGIRDSTIIDTTGHNEEPWQPDPKKALWFSMALPGLGQIYNHSWWKTPLIYGGLGVSIWFIKDNHQNYLDFRTAYSESFDPNSENELVQQYPNQVSLRNIRDIYYKRYQLSIIATAAIYLMNGIEAYVDAHLKNFEISDDLSLRYGVPTTRQDFFGSYSYTPNVFPIVGITYKLN